MRNTAITAMLSVVPVTACAQHRAAVDGRATIGVIGQAPNERWCLAIADSGLTLGDTVLAVAIPVGPLTSIAALDVFEVIGVHPGICGPLWGAFGDADYELKAGTPGPGSPSVTVLGANAELLVTDSAVQTDLDGDGNFETFRSCTSYEGLHLSLWGGPPLQSARLWHRYFALGYDVEPSCTEADYAEPK